MESICPGIQFNFGTRKTPPKIPEGYVLLGRGGKFKQPEPIDEWGNTFEGGTWCKEYGKEKWSMCKLEGGHPDMVFIAPKDSAIAIINQKTTKW
jgi:hypothetical protein